jgi:hypothetical protein
MKYPSTATFLTDYEKRAVARMLKEDCQGLATHYDSKFVWQAITDYKTYVQVGIYIGLSKVCLSLYSILLMNAGR